jgi:competence protein ComGC
MAAALVLATAANAVEVTEEHGECFRQQHTLAGALWSYTDGQDHTMEEIPFQEMWEEGHMPSSWTPGDGLQDPGAGHGSHVNYQFSPDAPSGITCSRHGYPGHARALPNAEQAGQCHDVQRTVSGAVSMYNLDNNLNVETIPWVKLQEEGYLHNVPEDPGQGPFSYMNYEISAQAPLGLICKVHGSAPYDREFLRQCLATQRLVSGAVEMYNLDFNENVESIPWDALVGGGYLVRKPRDPGGPDGSHTRYSLDPNSPTGIRCSRHGSAGDWTHGGAAGPMQPVTGGTSGAAPFGLPTGGDG